MSSSWQWPRVAASVAAMLVAVPFMGSAPPLVRSALPGPTIIFVDDDAPLGGDGTSWDTAYRFPQDALAFASDPANGIAEIRVAQGVYLTDRDKANPDGSNVRESTFHLLNGLALRGGYAGIGAPDPNVRDVDLFLAILTGDIGGAGSSVDNSYHVVTASGTDETAVLDGFTITGGNACCVGSQLDPRRLGGGLYNLGGDARLISCTFTGNSACEGGGLYNEAGALSVTDCTFSGNVATGAVCIGAGGGMYTVDADPTLTNCTFTGNIAERGGAIAPLLATSPSAGVGWGAKMATPA